MVKHTRLIFLGSNIWCKVSHLWIACAILAFTSYIWSAFAMDRVPRYLEQNMLSISLPPQYTVYSNTLHVCMYRLYLRSIFLLLSHFAFSGLGLFCCFTVLSTQVPVKHCSRDSWCDFTLWILTPVANALSRSQISHRRTNLDRRSHFVI